MDRVCTGLEKYIIFTAWGESWSYSEKLTTGGENTNERNLEPMYIQGRLQIIFGSPNTTIQNLVAISGRKFNMTGGGGGGGVGGGVVVSRHNAHGLDDTHKSLLRPILWMECLVVVCGGGWHQNLQKVKKRPVEGTHTQGESRGG